MFGRAQKQAIAKGGTGVFKLHSIAAMMRGRAFAGRFEVKGAGYNFSYTPEKAAQVGGKLQLVGNLTITDQKPKARVSPRNLKQVRATLVSAQGGIGTAPLRKKLPAEIAAPRADLPIIESTGSLSFAGVLYFKLASLDSRLLGVPADMKQVQLNVRMAPVSDQERELQGAFSSIVDALLAQPAEPAVADAAIVELNTLLAAS